MSGVVTAMQWLAGAAGAGLGYSLFEAQAFTTRHVEAPVLAGGSLRVLHLSDLHLTPGQTRKIHWLRGLADLEPDLVVVTGDFLAHRMSVPAVAEALDRLLDSPGLFVFGSNDYHGPVMKNPLRYLERGREGKIEGEPLPTDDLRELLTDAGWVNLNNAQHRFEVGGVAVHARGTDDPHIGLDAYETVTGQFDDGALALGVTHAPYARVTSALVRDGAQLVLAGHTHGGQVCLPLGGALVTNCDLPRQQAKGLSVIRNGTREALLHVSAGVGTSPYTPVRFACRPEATLVTLTERTTH